MRSALATAILCVLILLDGGCLAQGKGGLPSGFVFLRDVDATIQQDIRYAGSHNFVGRPVAGYEAAECVLTNEGARALSKVQGSLKARDLSLIVWDCYRPARAVADFVSWSKSARDIAMKAEFYPRTDKAKMFALGYIAQRSGHSRGSTVDLGLVPASLSSPPRHDPTQPLRPCTSPRGERFDDGTVDLGTGYDCLDALATTTNPGISKEARANRLLLASQMAAAGFKAYSREWWHFELIDEPFPGRTFDFPIVARQAR